jgi:hypothetical protein
MADYHSSSLGAQVAHQRNHGFAAPAGLVVGALLDALPCYAVDYLIPGMVCSFELLSLPVHDCHSERFRRRSCRPFFARPRWAALGFEFLIQVELCCIQ